MRICGNGNQVFGTPEQMIETIKKLQEQLKQNQWISCKERMPDFNEQVLIYANGHVYTATRFKYKETEWWSANNTGNKQFRGATELPIIKAKAIKYWMPKPAAPIEAN
ncbi:MAG: hypothetical protein K0R78_2282 [Pelosinus sp.]|jgi:hypothetical protein|nr:hypothetical protein [Pelosinus sp.]